MNSRRTFLRDTALAGLVAGDMNERYFRNRADGFRLYGSGYMMNAQV